jgi:N-acetylglutamate synthase-like GNAT family acetyltransferase
LLVTAAALRQITREGIRDVYLVANNAAAETFFARCGFHPIAREDLPSAVSEHKQITRECPSGATVMRLVLPLGG